MEVFYIKVNSLHPAIEFTININRSGNLTGCTAAMRLRPQDNEGAITEYALTIDNAASGICSYQWLNGDPILSSANTYWGGSMGNLAR